MIERAAGARSRAGGRAPLPVVGVILAGGAGTRLWPVATPERPKQFVRLLGRRTPFQEAWDRLVPLVGRGNIVVVAGRAHVPWVRRQAPGIAPDRIVVEEVGRNTAASVALAALWTRARHGDAVMVVTPADHWIGPPAAFRATLRRAIGAARRPGALVTIGIKPAAPDPGFGYILPAGRPGPSGVRRVARFVEKPAAARARRMVRDGWLWNSGIFVWRAGSILDALEAYRPEVARPLVRWAGTPQRASWRVPGAVLRRLPAVPIDRAVLERSNRVLVTPARFRWSDLGNWGALAALLPHDGRGNGGVGGLLAVDSRGCLGLNEGGLTVFVGVEDLVAVREGRAVLICHRNAAQEVRRVVAALPEISGGRARG